MFGAEKGPRKSPAVLTDEVGPRQQDAGLITHQVAVQQDVEVHGPRRELRCTARPPAPRLPAEIIARTSEKYREALARITGPATH